MKNVYVISFFNELELISLQTNGFKFYYQTLIFYLHIDKWFQVLLYNIDNSI